MYSVRLTERAEKDVLRLRPHHVKALKAIQVLMGSPRKGHTLSGSLQGVRSLEFSLPGGAYRAAYVIREEEQECLVFLVGPHEGFYERAKRRATALRKMGAL